MFTSLWSDQLWSDQHNGSQMFDWDNMQSKVCVQRYFIH